jgi:hypothetical protein
MPASSFSRTPVSEAGEDGAKPSRAVGITKPMGPNHMNSEDINASTQPCLVCGRPLETSDPTKTGFLTVNDGIIYSTDGNYGSTVLDIGETIVFVICDACLVKHRGRLRAFNITRASTTVTSAQPTWTSVPVEEVIPDKLPENSSLRISPLDEFISEVESD